MQNTGDKYALIMTTASSVEEAQRLAGALVEESLAACVQTIPISSTYRWKGRVQEEAELLLLIKTRATSAEKIETRIKELHSYETPDILQVSITAGSSDYLSWMDSAVF